MPKWPGGRRDGVVVDFLGSFGSMIPISCPLIRSGGRLTCFCTLSHLELVSLFSRSVHSARTQSPVPLCTIFALQNDLHRLAVNRVVPCVILISFVAVASLILVNPRVEHLLSMLAECCHSTHQPAVSYDLPACSFPGPAPFNARLYPLSHNPSSTLRTSSLACKSSRSTPPLCASFTLPWSSSKSFARLRSTSDSSICDAGGC